MSNNFNTSETITNPLLTKLAQDVKSTVRKDNQSRASSKFALFLGAGASFSSGISIASGMINHFKEEIFERYGVKFENEKDEKAWLKTQDWYKKDGSDYSKLFEECYDTETKRRSYIESIIANSEPSFGYMVLANLIQEGYFRTIITTNFDDLVYVASTTFTSIRPVVYSLGGFATEMTLTSERPRVLKIHGDFLYSSLKNVSDELSFQDKTMAKEVQKVLEEYDGIIIVGYSGGDKSVMNLLKKIPKGKTVYWCYRTNSWLPQSVKNFINGNGKHLVEIDGFDELMNFIREFIGITNNTLANNHKSNLDKMTDLLFKFEDTSTISFVEEIAKSYQILSYKVYIDNAIINKDEKAIEENCRKILELDENDSLAYYNLGACAEKNETRFSEAENYYLRAININPNDGNFHLALANLISKNNSREQEALYIYNFIIKNFPNFADGFLDFGTFLSKKENALSDAEKLIKQAIRLNPTNDKSYYNLGTILVKNKQRNNEAEKLFLKAIEINPEFADAYDNLGVFYNEEKRDFIEAERLHRKAIEINPKLANAYNNLGTILSFDKNRINEAIQNYRKAIELNPNLASGYYNLAILFSEKEDTYNDAKQMFLKVIEVDANHAAAHNNFATILLKENIEFDTIKKYLMKAIELKPDYSEPYTNLGILYNNIFDNKKEAEKFFLKAIEVAPQNPVAHNNYGDFLSKYSSKQSEAEEAFRTAIRLNSNLKESYFGLAKLIAKDSKRIKEVENIYNDLIKLNPDSDDIYNNFGNFFVKQNNLDKAIEILRKAVEISPKNPFHLFSLAVAHKKRGNQKEAKSYANKGRKQVKDGDYYLLACFEAIIGKNEMALAFLKKAIDKNPSIKTNALSDSEFDEIRDNPKFKKIIG